MYVAYWLGKVRPWGQDTGLCNRLYMIILAYLWLSIRQKTARMATAGRLKPMASASDRPVR